MNPPKPFGLVIHGGAGAILKENMPPEMEAACRAKLLESVEAGYTVLERAGSALDAVVASVRVLEDSPLFNAGYGAVLNAEGQCELDAAIMDGRTLEAGAVAGLHHIKNPISLAREVMEKSAHVMLIGEGAENFAKALGHELVPNAYFQTDRRRNELARAQSLEAKRHAGKASRQLQEDLIRSDGAENSGPPSGKNKWGTVGCVALDRQGNLAAGTSTGGLTNKRYGRVGDSPIIGAGTYANNATCAVSCTGHGEYFMRAVAGHDISARMEYRGVSLAAAAQDALDGIARLGGGGGLVAIDRDGNCALPFNTPGMYRSCRRSDGYSLVEIFGAQAVRPP